MDFKWDPTGLVPAVAQDATTGRVLMVAWMNAEAVERTRATGEAHFYSRSRRRLWKKGEESGNVLHVEEIRVDCDADTVLLAVRPTGPACHTGKPSCFFRTFPEATADEGPSGGVLDRLARTIEARKSSTGQRSYTRSLLDGGFPRLLAKLAEEHAELAEVLPGGDGVDVVHEAADLLFHLCVALAARGIAPADVLAELGRRFGTSGHDEKASRSP